MSGPPPADHAACPGADEAPPPRPGGGRRLRGLLRLALSVTMLAAAWQVAGGDAVLRSLAALSPGWLALALLLTLPMQLLSALRWRLAADRLGVGLPLRQALREYYLASLLNAVLPGGVAGDAARVWRHGRSRAPLTDRYRLPLQAAVLERLAGQVALLAVLVFGVAANLHRVPGLAAWAGLLALAAGAIALVLAALRRMPAVAGLLAAARRVFLPAPLMAAHCALSLGVVGCYLAMFWCACRAVGAPPHLFEALLLFPLVLSAMALPISVGGLGVREASAAALWPLLDLSAADGALAALAYGVVVVAGSLPALASLPAHAASARRSRSKSTSAPM